MKPRPSALVIVADDLGYCRERCAAIIELHRFGAISAASLIVNSYDSRFGADMARQSGLSTGLHFNITEGKPTYSGDVSSLCDSEGNFLGKFGLRDRVSKGKVNFGHVRAELQGQIGLFKDMFGRVPHHVDGHQHVHVIPGICDVFACVLAENGVSWTRVPIEVSLDNVVGQRRQFYDEVVQNAYMAARIFREKKLRFASRFIGMATIGLDMTMDRLRHLLPDHVHCSGKENGQSTVVSCHAGNPESPDNRDTSFCDVIEWMVHPGLPAKYESLVFGRGPDEFALSTDRNHEFNFLSNIALRDLFSERNIHLCSFEELSART